MKLICHIFLIAIVCPSLCLSACFVGGPSLLNRCQYRNVTLSPGSTVEFEESCMECRCHSDLSFGCCGKYKRYRGYDEKECVVIRDGCREHLMRKNDTSQPCDHKFYLGYVLG